MVANINKYDIDKTEMMLHFIGFLHSEKTGKNKIDIMMSKFIEFIEQNIKREMSPNESLDLYMGCLKFVKSEAGTNERMAIMDYLFNLEFLN